MSKGTLSSVSNAVGGAIAAGAIQGISNLDATKKYRFLLCGTPTKAPFKRM